MNHSGKLWGANLTSKPGQPKESAYWIEWDWLGWIRPQIDIARAMGCNCVRIIGDVAMVTNGQISQATYDARWVQLVEYCASRGLTAYYTGCATYDTNGVDNGTIAAYNANPQAFSAVIASNLSALAGLSGSIVGADLVQEANAWGSTAAVQSIYAAVKPTTSVPCTFSSSGTPESSWIASIAPCCDYLDYHIYPMVFGIGGLPSIERYINGPLAAYPTKGLIFGECGADSLDFTPDQVSAWIAGCAAMGANAHPRIRGAMMWATQDQDEKYGAVDALWAPRPSVWGPWMRAALLSYIPAAPPAQVGTSVPPADSITDGSGAVWTLGAPTAYGRQVLRNGVSAAGGQGVVINWTAGQIKVKNSIGAWWLWTGSTWVATSAP